MNKWKNRTVGFDTTSQEEMELYQFSSTLPNFTHMVKGWLREERKSQLREMWQTDTKAHVLQQMPGQEVTREITGNHVMMQFT